MCKGSKLENFLLRSIRRQNGNAGKAISRAKSTEWLVHSASTRSTWSTRPAARHCLMDERENMEWSGFFMDNLWLGLCIQNGFSNFKQGIKNNFSGAISFYAAHNQALPDG